MKSFTLWGQLAWWKPADAPLRLSEIWVPADGFRWHLVTDEVLQRLIDTQPLSLTP